MQTSGDDVDHAFGHEPLGREGDQGALEVADDQPPEQHEIEQLPPAQRARRHDRQGLPGVPHQQRQQRQCQRGRIPGRTRRSRRCPTISAGTALNLTHWPTFFRRLR